MKRSYDLEQPPSSLEAAVTVLDDYAAFGPSRTGADDSISSNTTHTTTTSDLFAPQASSSSSFCLPAFCNNNNNNNNSVSWSRKKRNAPTDGERKVVEDLNALTLQEREQIFQEIHGIAQIDPIENSQATMEALVQDLKSRLYHAKKTKVKNVFPYEMASFLSQPYVDDRDFLLMFLRADQYDPKAATKRVLAYFAQKLELFGIVKLVKNITWKDLTPEDQQEVLHCSIQTFPEFKDASGRISYLWDANTAFRHMTLVENNLRMTWYNLEGIVRNHVFIQQTGLVGISYQVGDQLPGFTPNFAVRYCNLVLAMPFRYAALHFVYNDIRYKPVISMTQVFLKQNTRIRFRPHFGSHVEAQYSLMQYGFRKGMVPIDDDGNLQPARFLAYLRHRQAQEEAAEAEAVDMLQTNVIAVPSEFDVLAGKGRPQQHFPGNLTLTNLIESYARQYQQGTKDEKTVLTGIVSASIKSKGGRFLRRNHQDGTWTVLNESTTHEKVSNAFRAHVRKTANSSGRSSGMIDF